MENNLLFRTSETRKVVAKIIQTSEYHTFDPKGHFQLTCISATNVFVKMIIFYERK